MFGPAEMRSLREMVSRFAVGFDPDRLSGEHAAAVLKHAAAAQNVLAFIKAAAARRVSATHVYRHEGYRSAAHQLAAVSGSSVGAAKAEVQTAERLETLPATAEAQREGRLSPEKTAAIADAATVDPDAEADLLSRAELQSLAEVRDACIRVKTAADPDPEATRRRLHASRFARRRTCRDGAGEVTYRSTLEEVNEFWAVVQGYTKTVFDKARIAERHESQDAYAADAMLAMARAAAGTTCSQPADEAPPTTKTKRRKRVRRPVPAKLIFRCDWAAFKRGHTEGDEVCDIAGVGPVPVSVIRELLETDPFIAAVLMDGKDVMSVAHLGRSPNAYQLTALEWLQPECTVIGCRGVDHLEWDHRDDWAKTLRTPTDGLDRGIL